MPEVAGVVLATHAGKVVAHERARVIDPQRIAAQAIRMRHPDIPTSALVPEGGSLYLVVFVPPAQQRASSAMPPMHA